MEKEAQDYITSQYPLMKGRFITSVGTTNQGTAYHGRAAGYSPELARGLDSHGFADLDYAVSYCCSLASVYPMGDVRRQFWNQGTKEQLLSLAACRPDERAHHRGPRAPARRREQNYRPRRCCGA